MKAQVNKQEKIRQVSPAALLLGGLLGIAVGLMLATSSLILNPAVKAKTDLKPEQLVPGTVYYIAGDARNGGTYQGKLDQFILGSSVSLHHGELNQWASRAFKPSPELMKAPAFPPTISPMTPNFRIGSGKVQLSTELWVSTLPDRRPIYQVLGTFEKGEGGYFFKVESSSINQLPIPSFMGQTLFNTFASGYLQSEAIQALSEAWGKLSEVEVQGDRLRLAAK